jgi:hypothetical protein
MKLAEEKLKKEPDKEPLLMSSDVTGKRLCLSCRLMIFFLHNDEAIKFATFRYISLHFAT